MICDTPYYVLSAKWALEKVPVPCGKCPNCKKRRVDSWAFRLMQEEKMHETAHFVTLTYDTRFVPISPNGFLTLRKKDTQDFWKRLRKRVPCGTIIRYYLAGEYGTQNERPHYHAIVFGVPDTEMYNQAWGLGSVYVGTVTGDSVAYTVKYIDKNNFRKKHQRDDRQPEFSLMSKGLGANYITSQAIAYHRADLSRMYITKTGGHKIALPKYYRNRLYTEQERVDQVAIVQAAITKQEMAERRLLGDKAYEQKKESAKLGRYKAFYAPAKHNRK